MARRASGSLVRRPQGEAVLAPLPVGGDAVEIGARVLLTSRLVLLERRDETSGKVPGSQPQRSPILDAGAYGHATLMEPSKVAVLSGRLDSQPVFHLVLP